MKKNPSIYLLLLVLWLPGCKDIATYEGYVKDPAGDPLPNASVVIIKDLNARKIDREVKTDENGYYKIGIPDSSVYVGYDFFPYSLVTEKITFTKEEIEKSNGKLKAPDVFMKPRKGHMHVVGRVVDETGKPLEGVRYNPGKTTSNGKFIITYLLSNKTYEMHFTLEGYETEVREIKLDSVERTICLPDVVLKKSSKPVKAKKAPMKRILIKNGERIEL